jgi:hypothetical protein
VATRILHESTYDTSPAGARAMLTDKTFREEVCEFIRAIRHQVTVEPSGSATRVVIEQHMPARGNPSFAKKFVGDEIEIVQTEDWTSETHADVRVEIPGRPGHVTGTVDLREQDGSTVEVIDMTVKVHVPLVGGKIEGLIGDMLVKALTAEHKVGREYLTRQA